MADTAVRYWPGRIAFADGTQPAPFPSAIIVLGRLPGRHGTQPVHCAACGQWFFPAYSSRKACSEACRKAEYRARQVSQIQGRKRDRKTSAGSPPAAAPTEETSP